ncbi:glycosyltransferase [Pyrobaculum ferrireducens]|uniref:Glycosyl transferase, group 1 n=1 Tax=Pyrobaculum ferrireducens TaxID=1104324 RepID=G7VHN1_9CREN|nr:glycosyltransferase [Pyrobaculum ferrireducens]AET32053.1 glycosyl transferase, group 1 [Pyrobaculum ferrireducens]
MIVSITPELAVGRFRNFAGGLGVLEGDKFYAAARLGVPYTAITLYYPEGYVTYREENGELVPTPEGNTTEELRRGGGAEIQVRGDKVALSYLTYQLGTATAVFVNVEGPEWAAKAARRLYQEDTEADRFYKYVILAKAAVDYVERHIGWDRVTHLDLQEAYTVLAIFFRRHEKARLVIHTPAPWGHPTFSRRFFKEEFGFDMAMEPVILTELGLAMASGGVVVSRKMVKLACNTFPHHCHKIKPVTNAVEIPRWEHPRLRHVESPEELRRAREEVKREALRALGIEATGKVVMSWARRLTHYKRPHYALQLIEDVDRDVLFILGGRAHPADHYGVEMMKRFKEAAGSMDNVYYFPNLDADKARLIIWASDIWLFTPFSGWEASGTSFMKAGVNGVPSVASRDGAVPEAVRDGWNGWLFGEDRDRLLPLDSAEIDQREYGEFRRKVEEALDAYASGRYWEVAFNAYRGFREVFSMERLFRDYGYL